METTSPQRKRLPRALSELVVIVVGILLALAVDEWWSGVRDRHEESRILRAIHEEFLANREQFETALAHHERIRQAAESILGSSAASCDEALEQLIFTAVFNWRTYNPSTGETAFLIASGRLELLRDRTLRRHLAAWPGLMTDLAEDESLTIARRASLIDYVATVSPGVDCSELIEDQRFRFLISRRRGEEGIVIADMREGVAVALESILSRTR